MTALALALITGMAHSRLHLLRRSQQEALGSESIQYRPATLGNLPYGRRMTGALDFERGDACASLPPRPTAPALFLLLAGSNCTLHAQALNAQRAGARAVVAAEAAAEGAVNEPGALPAVEIPVLLISAAQAEAVRDAVRRVGALQLVFDVPLPKSDVVRVDYHLLDEDAARWQLLADFKPLAVPLGSRVKESLRLFKATDGDGERTRLQALLDCLPPARLHDAAAALQTACAANRTISLDCAKTALAGLGAASSCAASTAAARMPVRRASSRSFIAVNGRVYRGPPTPLGLFEAVCAAFFTAPDHCHFVGGRHTPGDAHSPQRHAWLRAAGWVATGLTAVAALLYLLFGSVYARVVAEGAPQLMRERLNNYRSLRSK